MGRAPNLPALTLGDRGEERGWGGRWAGRLEDKEHDRMQGRRVMAVRMGWCWTRSGV